MSNVLYDFRHAAMHDTNRLRAHALRSIADELDMALHALYDSPTKDHARSVNGLWAAGCALYRDITAPQPTPPRSSAGEVGEERQALAA